MEIDVKEKTAHNASVGADAGQSIQKDSDNSIPASEAKGNGEMENLEEMYRKMQRMADPRYLHTLTMTELFQTSYKSRPPIIENLLHSGAYILAGAPKIGKSFLVAQIAYHVSTGQDLWGCKAHQGTVLYLALEDDFQRIQNRMFMMYGVNDTPNLHFATAAGKIGNGLDEQLENFMREHPDTKLIIIDTMQKIREVGDEAYSYASDYEIVGKLKQFADKHCICVLTVHHTRKQPAGDAFEMISGTTGLLGCADGSLLMQKKKRTALEATIDVVGRDQQDQILYLKKDPETQIWNLERMETEPHKEPPDPVLEAVAKLVSAECPEWTGSPSELAAAVQAGMAANALTKYLNVKSGRLLEEYQVGYENRARHSGRQVKLTYMLMEAPAFEVVEDGRDGSDGCNGCNGENAAAQTTVAIVAAVAERNGSE
ncbi:MAG: helicase RepA family protein [Flintibacter sp.]|uniref:AAA family ATPase n=1 Tax=Flintibacter sp. TaxID=1918624 RepID=UPI0026733E6A|nr:AAA family ATPase [Flintibacter sp.]MCI6150016.1 helicase RepA family protein [Flintibacter sp.]MDY2656975.1 AAA family ATPase [Candidatus Limiplasma sp.]MDY5037628.1 AAA family ATPase [Lawsonibacter sp.]